MIVQDIPAQHKVRTNELQPQGARKGHWAGGQETTALLPRLPAPCSVAWIILDTLGSGWLGSMCSPIRPQVSSFYKHSGARWSLSRSATPVQGWSWACGGPVFWNSWLTPGSVRNMGTEILPFLESISNPPPTTATTTFPLMWVLSTSLDHCVPKPASLLLVQSAKWRSSGFSEASFAGGRVSLGGCPVPWSHCGISHISPSTTTFTSSILVLLESCFTDFKCRLDVCVFWLLWAPRR